jgi:hypothetical protein
VSRLDTLPVAKPVVSERAMARGWPFFEWDEDTVGLSTRGTVRLEGGVALGTGLWGWVLQPQPVPTFIPSLFWC